MSYKIFVDGQEGTTGLQINEYLAQRDDEELIINIKQYIVFNENLLLINIPQ